MADDKNPKIISLVTLCTIIIVTIIKRRRLRNASILIGILAGMGVSYYLGTFTVMDKDIQFVSLPLFNLMGFDILRNFCKINWLDIILAICPATFVVISENITKITLIEKIMRMDKNTQSNNFANFYRQSMFGHSISFLTSILLGAVPNAIYAENIALMEINNIEDSNKYKIIKEKDNKIVKYCNKLSNYPLIIAGFLCIFFSFFTFFQTILTSIPTPVYGGMKLFIFALISAQGVQLLVDRKVNYKKVINQILTSITLLTGLSNISINLKVTQISGISLAFWVGVVVNLVFNLLSYMGLINEKIKYNRCNRDLLFCFS